ncbi:MAG: RnfABCDGE type electron transport complex subunit D [Sedimentisphaerales bacterium]|nr:RnfABCDGE type electron transport complex subunit D [Sedimentisphaerales bacterium]
MRKNHQTEILPLPPFREVPESMRRMMRTKMGILLLPATAGWLFFGYRALALMVVAAGTAVIAELICNQVRHIKVPGSTTHGAMMGLLVALMLPAHAEWFVAVVGSVAAVVIGKQFFGGLGHYLWHPALVGRLIVQLFFGEQLAQTSAGLLDRGHIFFGNINNHAAQADSWLRVDWFNGPLANNAEAFLLTRPIEALRDFSGMHFVDSAEQMNQYLLEHLPTIQHCIFGAVPGAMGETCAIILLVAGLCLIYRGYMHWQMPVMFLAGAYLAAMVLPIIVNQPGKSPTLVSLPILSENIAVGFCYVNYQLFSGSLMLGAWVLAGEMTSRPITVRGQVIFALAGGVLTMIFRLYTPIAIPCYAAILVMNSLTPALDRLTRPRGRRALSRNIELLPD